MAADTPTALTRPEAPAPAEHAEPSPLQQLHTGTSTDDMRAAGKQKLTADTVPLQIVDGGHGQGQTPDAAEKAPAQAPASVEASAQAAQSERALAQASEAFGQAHPGAEQDKVLGQFRDIISQSDKNGDQLKQAVSAEAERLNPGLTAAGKALGDAVEKLGGETDKLSQAEMDKLSPELISWTQSNTAEGKKAAEERMRSAGHGDIADAMQGVDKVQHDYAAQFGNGEKTEDQITARFGQGQTDSMKAQVEARSLYQSALTMSGHDKEAAAAGEDLTALQRNAAHLRIGKNS